MYCLSSLRTTQPQERCRGRYSPRGFLGRGRGATRMCSLRSSRYTRRYTRQLQEVQKGRLSRCRRPSSNRRGAGRATRARATAPARVPARTSPASSSASVSASRRRRRAAPQNLVCTRASAAPRPVHKSTSPLSAMTRPCWLNRSVRYHRHAVVPASRRWRGGRAATI